MSVKKVRGFLPWMVLCLGLVVTFFIYNAQRKSFKEQLATSIQNEIKPLTENFLNTFISTQEAVARIAHRWEANKGTSKQSWEKDTQAYINDFKFIKALEWVDQDNIVRWVTPMKGNESALNFDLGSDPYRLMAINKAKLLGQNYSSKVVELKQGGKGFLSFFPMHYYKQHQGFILAVYQLEQLFKTTLNDSHFDYAVYEDEQLVYRSTGPEDDIRKEQVFFLTLQTIDMGTSKFHLHFYPKTNYLLSLQEKFSYKVLIFGLITTCLLFILSMMFISLKRKEEELSDINKRFELALDASGIGVWDYHIADNKLIWDEHMYNIYGVTPDTFAGAYEAWTNGLHPDDKEASEKALEDALSGKQDFAPQFRVVHPDGTIRHVQAHAMVIRDLHHNPTRMLGVNWDITKQKESETSLEQARHTAEQALEVRSRFLANMSHEIRTPLNGILSCSNLLLDNLKNDENIKLLHTVQNCGDSLLNIINDILDFSKIEAGKMELEVQPYNIEDNVNEIVELLSHQASVSGAVFHCDIDEQVPRWIQGDVTRFRQVLMNLVGNAIKFTKSKVRIHISAQNCGDEQHEFLIAVEDDGIGLSEEGQKRLFKSFSQVDASTTRKFGGTGLGLAICQGIVQAMGGSIWVESELNKGTRFSFNFKAQETAPGQISDKTLLSDINPRMALEHPLRILMAEDNRINQMVGRNMLLKLGYRIDLVGNGIEALEALRLRAYDLVLMDQHMPEMDGIEATKAIIAEFGETKRPRIIALTASAMKEDKDRCYAAGMDGFLSKPIKMEEVVCELYLCHSQGVSSEQKILDEQELLQHFDDLSDVQELAKLCLEDIHLYLEDIQCALNEQDSAKLKMSAHTLKGVLANFHADSLVSLALKLEIMGRENKMDGAEEVHQELLVHIETFKEELEQLINERAA